MHGRSPLRVQTDRSVDFLTAQGPAPGDSLDECAEFAAFLAPRCQLLAHAVRSVERIYFEYSFSLSLVKWGSLFRVPSGR